GADVIEPDLVATKDGVLVARHENEIGGTTNVADRFPDRRTTKTIDGQTVHGWFTEDFTLAELKTLRAKERLPFRSHEYDGRFQIPTFDEVVALADAKSVEAGRRIGVYPETKHAGYFRSIGLALEPRVVEVLTEHGRTKRDDPVFIQSFEPSSLQALRRAGLFVHVWTLRSEPRFLSPTYQGDPKKEYAQFAALGVDGIFGDFPDVARAALRPAESR
ncbi:MAG: glycerophosphodiester phosphodiesterase, partial [Acidobacteria bacterium]